MNVSAIVVTRGNVELDEIIDSVPSGWEVIEWNNGAQAAYRHPAPNTYWNAPNVGVYGRYAAIEKAQGDVIYVQDDDVVLEPGSFDALLAAYEPGVVTANMSAWHQQHTLDSALVGFGSVFDRDLPAQAFARFFAGVRNESLGMSAMFAEPGHAYQQLFHRTCDVVFTALTPRKAIDVPYRYLPCASDADRMSRQEGFAVERERVLDLARRIA